MTFLQEGSVVVVVLNATCSPIHRHELRRRQKRNTHKKKTGCVVQGQEEEKELKEFCASTSGIDS